MTENTSRAGTDGLSRRELLGRGVKLGGAVLWMTPVVQTIGMGRAFASNTSGPCVVYCVKYEVDEKKWVALGSDNAAAAGGNCFTCPSDAVNGLPNGFDGNAVVSGSPSGELTVTLPPGCSVVDTSKETGSPDLMTGDSAVAVKCGSQGRDGDDACRFHTIEAGATSFKVTPCGNGKAISNIELVIKCCPT